MQWKHVIAGVLSLLLLGVSSLASACELSCTLSAMRPASSPAKIHSAEEATSDTNMAHSHCGHAKVAPRSRAIAHHFEDAANCDNAPCTQAQILLSPVIGKDAAGTDHGSFAVVAMVVSTGDYGGLFARVKRKSSQLEPNLVDPLVVALRI
ncbi:MAG: hypothetical protein WA655_09700 [Candidatus Korobacteraceae bacterium]